MLSGEELGAGNHSFAPSFWKAQPRRHLQIEGVIQVKVYLNSVSQEDEGLFGSKLHLNDVSNLAPVECHFLPLLPWLNQHGPGKSSGVQFHIGHAFEVHHCRELLDASVLV